MNPVSKLSTLAFCACLGMALSYGTVNHLASSSFGSSFGSYGYSGYPVAAGFGGGLMGGGGGAMGGGIFSSLIYLFFFLVIVQVLFSNNNNNILGNVVG